MQAERKGGEHLKDSESSENIKAHNPHDAFFKCVMSNRNAARDFFLNYLPEDILKFVDLGSLQIKKDSFIEKELKRFYSDILYQAKLKKGNAYFYILFEHQSSPSRLIGFRLLRYMVKIWELELKQKPGLKLLPPIIPIVLYHGRKRWDVGRSFADIVNLGERKSLRLYLPDFVYQLYDFSLYSDDEIKGDILLRICLGLLKHIFDNNLSGIKEQISLLRFLSYKERTALEFIEAVFRYLMSARDDAAPDILKKIVDEAVVLKEVKEIGGVIMTVAEQLIEQGEKRGLKRGLEKGLKKGLKKGLGKGLEKGELIGSIRTIQSMKEGMRVWDRKELEKLSNTELRRKLKELAGNQATME